MSDPIAVIVAHADDEVLGCGGFILRSIHEGRLVHVLILADGVSSRSKTFGEDDNLLEREARGNNALLANQILGTSSVTQYALPDNRLDSMDLLDVVKIIEDFLVKHQVGVVLTHHAGDVNIDHRVIHDAVIAACRPQPGFQLRELLFFEVASSTEWRPPSSGEFFKPNYFVDISEYLPLKLKALEAYKYELRDFPHPRSVRAVEALSTWRGAMVGVGAAEAFILGRKIVTGNARSS